jgi:2-C-methyl-D-erythritol 4-phosphate cytidylyltransferase
VKQPVGGAEAGGVWGIIVAAGRGDRFGEPKQFCALGGMRVVDQALMRAARACDGVVLVLPPGVAWDGDSVAAVVGGGDTRSQSVRAGLGAVPPNIDVVVVHDAARPLASPELFDAVIEAVRSGADGAIPGLPLTDTVKRVDRAQVAETLDREHLVKVQTPQAFRTDSLRRAHAAGGDATDDASLVEAFGGKVVVVPGEARNIKITDPTDLLVATSLLDA